MKELLWKKGIWAASAVVFLAMFSGIPMGKLWPPLPAGSVFSYYKAALQSQMVIFIIPAAGVLPAGAVFIQEKKSGFLKLYSIRINREEYVRRKLWQIYVGGFFPFLTAGLLFFLVCFFLIYPRELVGGLDREAAGDCFFLMLRICLLGGIMGEIAGSLSAIFVNYYMAYGLPFVCYYMLIILKDRYLPDMYAMDPQEWVACERHWGESGNGIWMFLLAFTAASVLLCGILTYQRLKEIV